MSETVQFNFTNINHEPRKKLGLTMNEYAVCDLIYHLSNNPTGDGWCYASKERLGEYLDLSKQSVHTIINKLIEKKLATRHESTKHLKTTKAWYEAVIVKDSKESLPSVKEVYPDSKESLPQDSKESLPPIYDNNKTDNDITNTIPVLRGNTKLVSRVMSEDHQLVIFMQQSLEEELTPTKYKFNLKCAQSLLTVRNLEQCQKIWNFARSIQGMKGAPRVASLADLEDHWQDLKDFANQKNNAMLNAHNFQRRGPAHVNPNT